MRASASLTCWPRLPFRRTIPRVECRIDWDRRFDHMQQHSGQHLLSAVFVARFALPTVSFHLGEESSTIDLDAAALRHSHAARSRAPCQPGGFRKPPDCGRVRGCRRGARPAQALRAFRRSAHCLDNGPRPQRLRGTRMRLTGEIGPILIRKLEKVRNTVRLEFLCGGRAVRRARADFDALARVAQMFSGALEDVPELVRVELESARAGDKVRRKLEADLAQYQGRELYAATTPDETGARHAVRRLSHGNLEELRALAQSFTAQSKGDLYRGARRAAVRDSWQSPRTPA